MTGRILAALLLITGGLLLGTILPLGITMTRQQEHDFRAAALTKARAVAAAAEESIVDRPGRVGRAELADTLRTLAGPSGTGDAPESVIVLDTARRTIGTAGSAGSAGAREATEGLVSSALSGRARLARIGSGDEAVLVAAVPIAGHGRIAGAVLLARSLDPLDDRVRALWLGLAGESALAVTVATVLAVALARWVGRPLRDLETTAEALGSGRLDIRASTGTGPSQVRRLAERFNVMAARLENLIDDHRVMLADVSHQLRTPLAALRLRMELLSAETTPDAAEDLEGALEELARLTRLVDGLLAVARAENTTAPPVAIKVAAVLTERTEAWRPVAEERGVVLAAHLPWQSAGLLVALLGDGHLEQVIDNLIDNALHALASAGTTGHVRLTATRSSGGRIEVTVADDGPGMPAPDREQAFRRFRTGKTNGTGLGLAIVHRLITADGGTVALAETPGGGLTVTLELPAAQ